MIATWARKYIGLPYQDAAWGPDYYDCWGILALVYRKEFDIDIIDDMVMYSSRIDKVKRLQKYIRFWKPVDNPEIGDGVLCLIAGKLPHCGIYVGDKKMLHSIENTSSCIQRLDHIQWRSRIEGYYRYSPSNS